MTQLTNKQVERRLKDFLIREGGRALWQSFQDEVVKFTGETISQRIVYEKGQVGYPNCARELITQCLRWVDTPQGQLFWERQHYRYREEWALPYELPSDNPDLDWGE